MQEDFWQVTILPAAQSGSRLSGQQNTKSYRPHYMLTKMLHGSECFHYWPTSSLAVRGVAVLSLVAQIAPRYHNDAI